MNTRDPEALRSAFYESIEPLSMAPLWTRLKGLVRREPAPGEAYRWSYGQVRPYLMESATHISAEEAERRVLILENPAFRGASRVTPTLFSTSVLPSVSVPGSHSKVISSAASQGSSFFIPSTRRLSWRVEMKDGVPPPK